MKNRLLTLFVATAILNGGCRSEIPGVSSLKHDKFKTERVAESSKEFLETPSGLKYRILRESDGKKPRRSSKVTCHYKGWLDGGKVFDSSYLSGKPIEFELDHVVPGWTEGLQLIGEGGKIELEVPGKLGYGPRGQPDAGIGPNETLHFTIELKKVS